jgi:hypothetical protein
MSNFGDKPILAETMISPINWFMFVFRANHWKSDIPGYMRIIVQCVYNALSFRRYSPCPFPFYSAAY